MHPLESLATSARRHLMPRKIVEALRPAYAAFLEVITGGRGIPRSINGEAPILVSPKHRHIAESYEPTVHRWIKGHVSPGDIILDVGAHYGIYSLLGARWVRPGGKIFAFEPTPETLSVLKRHIKLNHAEDDVEVVPMAVGATAGKATLHTMGSHDYNTLASTALGLHDPIKLEVPVITLDRFCTERGVVPRLIKIDTEGWELHILRGSAELLRGPAKVQFVVEMHPYAWEGAGYTRSDFESFLRVQGLEVVPLTGQVDPLAVYGDIFLRRQTP